MNIVFMGTPVFAKNILQKLVEAKKYNVVAVYTKEDAVRGRGKNLVPSPVKEFAIQSNIPVETPKDFKSEQSVQTLTNYKPDFICVAAYGLILPIDVLKIPKACLNVHGSLLPKWRGAAPVQRAILAGDEKTGTTIMKMDEGLDTGDYSLQSDVKIESKNLDDIFFELSESGSKDLMHVLDNYDDLQWVAQDETLATIANKLDKRELWLKNGDSPQTIIRKVKASSPESPCKCNIANRNVTILDAELVKSENTEEAIANSSQEFVDVVSLKPDGKAQMTWDAFLAGVQDKSPDNLRLREID